MQEQEYRLMIPNEQIYDNIYKDYVSSIKQAKIMISDYYDGPNLELLHKGVVIRKRTEDGRNVVQTKKKIEVTEQGLFVSESKEEVQSDLTASKMYHFVLRQNNLKKIDKVLTLRTLRQMYFCKKFDFILDKTEYEDHIHNTKGLIYEIEMEILSFRAGDKKFLQRMKETYNLEKSRFTKMEKILFNHLNS